MKNLFIIAIVLFATAALPIAWAAQERIDLSPSAPFDRFVVMETLALFWVAIIGLIVIIRMKLREVERTQQMTLDKEEKDAPFLD
jgi:hypothetical protein